MSFFRRPREERGASAIFFALSLVILVAALGLSVDVGNVAYERTKAQHAADAAARQLAYQCARYPTGAECSSLQETATTIAGESIDGGAVLASRNDVADSVTVTVDKMIETPLLSMVGVPAKDVAATATAKVGVMQANTAYDVVPLGVHYCTWKNWSNLAGTSQEATRKTTLRTDVLQDLEELLELIPSELLDTVDTKGLTEQLGTDAVAQCQDGDGDQVLTLNGASWLIDQTVVDAVVGKLFNWDSQNCRLDISADLVSYVRTRTNSGYLPQGCPSHFGAGKLVERNKTVLLPIFKPRSQSSDRLDLKLGACASPYPASATCAELLPPKIGVEIVGFAPFHVTGWRFSNPNDPDPNVSCTDIPLQLDLRGLIEKVLTSLDGHENYQNAPTDLQGAITCHGLQGYFTKSFEKDPNAEYEIGDEDFGASYASLVG